MVYRNMAILENEDGTFSVDTPEVELLASTQQEAEHIIDDIYLNSEAVCADTLEFVLEYHRRIFL